MQVLIVDDDIATVDVISSKVHWEALGIDKVYTAYNISRAKEILSDTLIDIVISDIEMPQGDGIDLLKWFREEKLQGEFLLLTCHESFDYANKAIKLQAAEYLLKPFDVDVMEVALKKLIMKINDKIRSQSEQKLGQWAKKNMTQVQLSFLRMVVEGRISGDIAEEAKSRELELDTEAEYRLVISKITDIEKDRERIPAGLFSFVLENIHSEVMYGIPENTNVLSFDMGTYYKLICVCEDEEDIVLEKKCKELIYQIKELSSATVSCCVSRKCRIEEFSQVAEKCQELLNRNVSYYGSVFFEENVEESQVKEEHLVDENKLIGLIEDHDKIKFMGYLKETLQGKMLEKTLSSKMLYSTCQEILKSVYTYFAKKDIDATNFWLDEQTQDMTKKAPQSVVDTLRWANYLMGRIYEYEQKNRHSENNIDKINRFIHEHYMENIGRREIAEELHLAPEYVSKLYKKETGMSLTDYISQYRIERAKVYLEKDGMTIGEVSEACGFENFTYFSTIFKKYTGVTPNQYRKNL